MLVDRIIKHFKAGITLDEITSHYIESTFSSLSFSELVTLIQAESNHESAPLIELIFYPSLLLQTDLEPVIEKASFDNADENCLVDMLVSEMPRTILYSPDHGKSAEFAIPKAALAPLISRLNITKKLPLNLIAVIHQSIPLSHQNQIKVHLRNCRFNHFPSHINFLIRFFSATDPMAEQFIDRFRLVLDLLSEQKTEVNLLMALEDKAQMYQKLHQEALQFETQLARHNMETLMFQGVRAPQIGRTEIEKRIVMIGHIKNAVFGEGGL